MKKYNCPSCAAEMVFQSSLSVYAVCPYCNSTVVRHDVNLEAIGTMAALPDDMSPLQIGTEAFFQGTRFSLVGRMKIGWKDGVWNEWFINTDDGRKGWLAEAQGFYAVCFEIEDALDEELINRIHQRVAKFRADADKNPKTPSIHSSDIGSYLTLNKQKLKVVDIKHALCFGSEGELPFAAPKGRRTVSIDLLGASGEFGCVEVLNNEIRVYAGQYVDWDALRCQNLRQLEGW